MKCDEFVPARLVEELDARDWSDVEVMNDLERTLRALWLSVRRSRSFRRAARMGYWGEQTLQIGRLFAALQLGDDDEIVLTLSRWRDWGEGLRVFLTLSRDPASPGWEARVDPSTRIDPPDIRELRIPSSRITLAVVMSCAVGLALVGAASGLPVYMLSLALGANAMLLAARDEEWMRSRRWLTPVAVAFCLLVDASLPLLGMVVDLVFALGICAGLLALVSTTLEAVRAWRRRDPSPRSIELPEYAALRSELAAGTIFAPTADWIEPARRPLRFKETLTSIARRLDGAETEYRRAMRILVAVRVRAVCRWRIRDEVGTSAAVEAWQKAVVRACRLVSQSDAHGVLGPAAPDQESLQAAIDTALREHLRSERHTREATIELIVALLGITVSPRAELRQAWFTAWTS